MIQLPMADSQSVKREFKTFSMVSGHNDRMAGSTPVWEGKGGFAEYIADSGFSDIIDIVNPLQHIPIVSKFYQSMTGDTIGNIAKIVGGALFGGPLGAMASTAMVVYQSAKENETQPQSQSQYHYASHQTDPANRREGFMPYNV